MSTSPADPPASSGQDSQPPAFALSRRRLIETTALLTLGWTLGQPGYPAAVTISDDERGEPFDDGTYFDDGYGWAD